MRKKFGPAKTINAKNLGKLSEGPGVYGLYNKSTVLIRVGRAKIHRPEERIKENVDKFTEAKKFAFIKTKTVEEAKRLETLILRTRKPRLNKEEKGK